MISSTKLRSLHNANSSSSLILSLHQLMSFADINHPFNYTHCS